MLVAAVVLSASLAGCNTQTSTSAKSSDHPTHTTKAAVSRAIRGAPGWKSQSLSIGSAVVTSNYDTEDLPGSVSCATKDFCIATGETGYVWKWNGLHWSLPTKAIDVTPSFRGAFAVSCPTPIFCMLITRDQGAIFDGHSWKPVEVNLEGSGGAPSLSCASSELCLAENGSVSLWNGHEWKNQNENLLPNGSASVACASSDTSCIAVDAGGITRAYRHGAWIDVGSIPTSPIVPLLFCASSDSCLGLDENGGTWRFNGTEWSQVAPSESTELPEQMDCGSVDFCVATQNAEAMVWNGSNWSTQVPLYPQQSLADASGISCPPGSNSCVGILQIFDGQGDLSSDWGLSYKPENS